MSQLKTKGVPRPLPRVGRKTRRAIVYARTQGLRSVLAKVLGYLVYRRIVLVGMPLAADFPDVESLLDVEIRELMPDDADMYVEFLDLDPSTRDAAAARLVARMRAGTRGYGAWFEGRIISAIWGDVGVANLDAIGACVALDPLDIYGRDAYTLPEFRGQNVATFWMIGALRILKSEGYECVMGFILPENKKAFGPPTKAGMQRLGSIGWFGLGPLRCYFVAFHGAPARFMRRLKRPGRAVDLELGRPCASLSAVAE